MHPRISRNTAITVGGFAAIVVGFLLLGYLPYYRQRQALRQEIVGRQDEMAAVAQQSVQLKEATRRAQLINASLQIRDYDRLVPVNKDLGTFLRQLSEELDAAGMQDTAVRALPPTALGKCQQLPIEIKGVGTFEQFHGFLVRLEHLPRMSSVSRLHIEADNAVSGKVSVELTLAIYNTKAN